MRNGLYLFTRKNLTDAAVIDWEFDLNPAFVSISASRTLDITGPVADFPTFGSLAVTHTVAGTTLTLPGDDSHVHWAEGAGDVTWLEFQWTGSSFIWKSNVQAAAGSATQLTAPTLTITAVSASQVDFSWNDVANEDGYAVQLYSDAGFTTLVASVAKASGSTSHSFTGLSLTEGATVYGRVKAEGSGSYSDSDYGTASDVVPTASTDYHNSTFTAANGTTAPSYNPEVGAAWANSQGTWEIQNNKLITTGSAPTGNNWVTFAEVGQTLYRWTIVVDLTNTGTYLQFWVLATDLNNAVIVHVGDVGVAFYNLVGGTATEFVAVVRTATTGVKTYDIYVTTTGTDRQVELRIDGASVTNAIVPTAQTGTKVGLATAASATPGQALFDSEQVVPYP